MIYSSLLFIYVFFPVSLLLYYVTPEKYRNITLLALSVIFCGMNGAAYLLFLASYTALNFGFCHLIGKYRKNKFIAKGMLTLALVLDISVIFIFRSDFFSAYRELMSIPEVFFPVGISFFTLSAVGTLADVYSGRTEPEKNIVYFALYMMFFPRIIMGPPMRYSGFRKMLRHRKSGLADIGDLTPGNGDVCAKEHIHFLIHSHNCDIGDQSIQTNTSFRQGNWYRKGPLA